MVIAQREVWWADLGEPRGSEPRYLRPVVVVQSDSLNRSALRTVVCVALTSRLSRAGAPGNSILSARATGLARDSVANVSHIVTVDRSEFIERTGQLSAAQFEMVLSGIDMMLGRS
jgi:mRNA interferase MazF